MAEPIDMTLAAYVNGAVSRDSARASIGAALAEGQRITSHLDALPPGQRADAAALLGEVTNDLLQSRPGGDTSDGIASGPHRRRWPPFGYSLIAGLLALDLTSLLIGTVLRFHILGDVSLMAGPWPLQLGFALITVAEGVAAWAVWTQRREAPEIFAAWAGAALIGSAYQLIAVGAATFPRFWVFALGAPVLKFGLGYWYLARHRVPAV